MADCLKFVPFVVTASGLNVEDPTGMITTVYDYNEWHDLAWRFIEIYEANVDRLWEVLGANDSDWPEAIDQFKARYKAMPPVFMVMGIPMAPAAEDGDIIVARDLTMDVAKQLCRLDDNYPDDVFRVEHPWDLGNPPDKATDLGDVAETVAQGLGGIAVLALASG